MLQSLRLFVAAYETRSFTSAAAREHATQSGVSQHVRNLERRHGVRLFERAGGAMVPTPAADAFYGHCLAALRAAGEGEAALRAHGEGLSGTATVGLMPTLTAAALAPALLAFRARHPQARVRVVEAFSQVLTAQVLAGELDFAVVPAMAPPPGLRISGFAAMDELFVARAATGGTGPVRLADCPPLRLVLPEAGNVRAATIRAAIAAAGATITDEIALDSMLATLDLVARSDWCAILPALLLASPRLGGGLVARPLEPPLRLELVSIEPARQAPSPVAQAFRACLAEAARALSGG